MTGKLNKKHSPGGIIMPEPIIARDLEPKHGATTEGVASIRCMTFSPCLGDKLLYVLLGIVKETRLLSVSCFVSI